MNKLKDFICHLVDNHEGDIITEEFLAAELAEFIKASRKTVRAKRPAQQRKGVIDKQTEGYFKLIRKR